METEESFNQENNEEILNKDTPLKIELKEDNKQNVDFSEPPTKKRVQLVTLSSPKNKKYLNK